MKKIIFYISVSFILISCELDWEGDTPYYKFSKKDYEYIPTVYKEVGKIFTFVNQFNDKVKIEVLKYEFTKESGGVMSLSQPYSEFNYCQVLTIRLKVLDEDLNTPNCDSKTIIIYKGKDDYLATNFLLSTAPDPCVTGSYGERIEYPYATETMMINSIKYNKVVIISNSFGFYFHKSYAFDKIYYDCKNGIIGFDDTANGIEFRIINT